MKKLDTTIDLIVTKSQELINAIALSHGGNPDIDKSSEGRKHALSLIKEGVLRAIQAIIEEALFPEPKPVTFTETLDSETDNQDQETENQDPEETRPAPKVSKKRRDFKL